MKTFADIINKFTHADYSEPSDEVVRYFKESFGRLFQDAGFISKDIQNYESILGFMARYQLAIINHLEAQRMTDAHFRKIYEDEISGKKFALPHGLLLFGNYGTGKTLAARIIADYFQIPMIDTYTIGLHYQTKEGYDWLAKWLFSNCQKTIVIDDLGAEGDIRKFGNESPMGAILSTRARYWETFGVPTIYTTNFATPEAVAKEYSDNKRLLDRLESYYVPVKFTGASLRK